MKILYAGTPSPSALILEHLINNSNHEIIGVLTQPDKYIGRNRKSKFPSPVSEIAYKNNVNIYKIRSFSDLNEVKDLKKISFDCMLVAAYGKIIPKWLLLKSKYKPVNIHYSLLPKYRGASPIQAALLNGDKYTGITFMEISEKLDEGNIIKSYKITINENHHKESLETDLCDLAISKIDEVMKYVYSKNYKSIPQNNSHATYCKKITKEDSYINFNMSTKQIISSFKAFKSWPGINFVYKDIVIKIHGIKENIYVGNEQPGEILDFNKNGIYIKTGDSSIVITNLQFPNKKIISSIDAFNSHKNFFTIKDILQ